MGFGVGLVSDEADEVDAVRFLHAARLVLMPACDDPHSAGARGMLADREAVLGLWSKLEGSGVAATVIAAAVRQLLADLGRLDLVERFVNRRTESPLMTDASPRSG